APASLEHLGLEPDGRAQIRHGEERRADGDAAERRLGGAQVGEGDEGHGADTISRACPPGGRAPGVVPHPAPSPTATAAPWASSPGPLSLWFGGAYVRRSGFPERCGRGILRRMPSLPKRLRLSAMLAVAAAAALLSPPVASGDTTKPPAAAQG